MGGAIGHLWPALRMRSHRRPPRHAALAGRERPAPTHYAKGRRGAREGGFLRAKTPCSQIAGVARQAAGGAPTSWRGVRRAALYAEKIHASCPNPGTKCQGAMRRGGLSPGSRMRGRTSGVAQLGVAGTLPRGRGVKHFKLDGNSRMPPRRPGHTAPFRRQNLPAARRRTGRGRKTPGADPAAQADARGPPTRPQIPKRAPAV